MNEPLHIQRADLYADWITIARERLLGVGFAVGALQPTPTLALADATGLAYFNALLHLTIPARPRQVHRAAGFVCPPALAEGLSAFEAKVRAIPCGRT
jgi:hypothetical protein